MKSLLLTVVFATFSIAAFAQCCPYINGIAVLPVMPTEDDSVYVVTTVTTPNQGVFLGSSAFVYMDTIYIDGCHYNGMLTAPQTYIDTVNVGLLPVGTYSVKLTARISSSPDNCIPNGQQQDSVFAPFTVTVGNAVEKIHQVVFKTYPNPASNELNIAHRGMEIVWITSATGTTTRPRFMATGGDIASIDTSHLPSGHYTVTLRDKNGILHRSTFVKE